ncbi:RNA polymerase sigma-70 factor [Parapedobacter deserti]|uniref:RNA polymerase sigma-70 factor n=1 Tax=Parapedobacter deserti TaxID=1912957 RepID=A0ABV7JR85_9SPHI
MQDNVLENELLSRLRKGDEQALSKLMDHYFVPLCSFCNVFIADMATSEELVADVFYTIWTKRMTLEIHTNFKSYIYTAVKNKALKKKKNLSSSRSVPLDTMTSDVVDPQNALTQLTLQEFNCDIKNLIQTLPEKRRVIFELNRFESLSYKEIATLLHISEKTVHNQISLAIKYLRPRISSLLNNIS